MKGVWVVLGLLTSTEAAAQDVLVVGSCRCGSVQTFIDVVTPLQEFVRLDGWNAELSTPLRDTMSGYHAVILFADVPVADPVLLGDELAAYVRDGGAVVAVSGTLATGTAIEGELVSDGLLPVIPGHYEVDNTRLGLQAPGYQWLPGRPYVKGHDSVYGFNRLTGGARAVPVVRPGSVVTAVWDDGVPLAIVREGNGDEGRTVALNLHHFPYSITVSGQGHVIDPERGGMGDVPRLIVQSTLWAIGYQKPFGTWENLELEQDLDCDLRDVADEAPVDPAAPIYGPWVDGARERLGSCADRLDPVTGLPYNSDYFYDPASHGCSWWLGDDDPDVAFHLLEGDGLVGPIPGQLVTDPVTGVSREIGVLPIEGPGGALVSTATLSCDNCPTTFNPDQFDMDHDEVGDLCDVCPRVFDPDQLDSDWRQGPPPPDG